MHYTIRELAGLMNITLSEDLFLELFVISEHVFVYRFANRERPLMAYTLMNLEHDFPDGAIVLWEGEIEDIPDEWYLCDGNNQTPDLRDRFIVGAGGAYAVGNTGDGRQHNHNFTGDGHGHTVRVGPRMNTGTDLDLIVSSENATGTFNNTTPTLYFRSLAYIMFIGD